MTNERGHWWAYYEPPDDDAPLPEWLLDIAAGDDPTSAARPWFMIKTDRNLKEWDSQLFIKNKRYYRTFNADGRMVQYQAAVDGLKYSKDIDAWCEDLRPNRPSRTALRLQMRQLARQSFLGGVVRLVGGARWEIEGDVITDAFNGDFRGKDVVLYDPAFGVEPEGYARVGFVVIDRLEARYAEKTKFMKWWKLPSTPNLCVKHELIARAVAKLAPELRCVMVKSSFGKRLEPITRKLTSAPKMMMASEKRVISAPQTPEQSSDQAPGDFLFG